FASPPDLVLAHVQSLDAACALRVITSVGWCYERRRSRGAGEENCPPYLPHRICLCGVASMAHPWWPSFRIRPVAAALWATPHWHPACVYGEPSHYSDAGRHGPRP